MIILNITVEGFSEELFVKDILTPHLWQFNILVQVRKVLTNRKLRARGGVVSYLKFKNDIQTWFKESPKAYHTSLIDLYGLDTEFPGFLETKKLQPYPRILEMERRLAEDLKFRKFIPYISLHEFEALLFSEPETMQNWLGLYSRLPEGCFETIRQKAPDKNPELINGGNTTSPSKRIEEVCASYDKVTDGVLILKEIGLERIRQHCKHFDEWLTKLEKLKE